MESEATFDAINSLFQASQGPGLVGRVLAGMFQIFGVPYRLSLEGQGVGFRGFGFGLSDFGPGHA